MALLRTQALKKHFGETRAVDGVDFTVNEGEFLSLVGTNGAGKTTLVNLISAFLLPDSGRILIGDRDITHATVDERIRAGIARSFQLVNLFDDLSVLDNVSLSIFAREGKTRRFLSSAERDHAVAGEARELLAQFVLDEPTSGVSTREKAQIMDTVSSVVRAGGVTAVVIEHDMDVVFKYSDRVVVMHEGRFLADGPPEEIRRNGDVAKYLLGTDV